MKKKPAVQAVLDNLSDYTVEQIQGLSGSHFPQWIKDELIILKKGTGKTPEEIAAMMNEAAGALLSSEIELVTEIYQESTSSGQRKFTAADFAEPTTRNGAILDSETQGVHETVPGFEEHMRKVRERMRGKI